MVLDLSKEQEEFVLYQYLKYFWKRKLILILIPITLGLIFSLLYYLFLYEEVYTGESTIYTGSVVSNSVTNATNLEARYEEDIENQLDISSALSGYISVKITGETKDLVLSELDYVTKSIESDLVDNYNLRLNKTKDNLEMLKSLEIEVRENIEEFKKVVDINEVKNIYEREYPNSTTEILLINMQNLSNITNSIHNMNNSLAFFEEPETLSLKQETSKNYIVETMVIGFVIGTVLAILILILLKYINDASAYFKSSRKVN